MNSFPDGEWEPYSEGEWEAAITELFSPSLNKKITGVKFFYLNEETPD